MKHCPNEACSFRFFGPHVAMDVTVPVPLADDARTLVRRVLARDGTLPVDVAEVFE